MGCAIRPAGLVALIVALVFGAGACRATAQISAIDGPPAHGVAARDVAAAPPSIDDNPFADPVEGGGIDFRLTRSDIRCELDSVNPYPQLTVVVAHVVVDGNLGAPCHGEPDERLVAAWRLLASISPPGELHDLAMFTGFESTEPGRTTLAYVNRVDAPEAPFQMAVNLAEARRDPKELMLTMAHEFAHVITSTSDQLDSTVGPDGCETWHNRRGCFLTDSLMWSWIETFWGQGAIDEVDLRSEPSPETGLARCVGDPGFFGPYAASHPEEDFAEAFSAFVMRIEPRTDAQRDRIEWFTHRPELMRFRNLAIEADLGPLRYRFESCG